MKAEQVGPTSLFLLSRRATAAEDLELDLAQRHEGQRKAGTYSGEDYQEERYSGVREPQKGAELYVRLR